MNDEQIKQRIAYLVEHGGMYDDPLAEIRATTRMNRVVACTALILLLVDIVVGCVG